MHDIDMVISFYNKKRFHNSYVRAKQGGFMRRVGTDCASKVSQIDLRWAIGPQMGPVWASDEPQIGLKVVYGRKC